MSYAILRVAKLNNNNSFARVFNHNHREYNNSPGVSKEREYLNIVDGPVRTYKEVKEILSIRNKLAEEKTGRKVRKDAVRGFEILVASDMDFLSDEFNRDKYFNNAIEFIKDTFGEENYLSSNIHFDEDGSPHLHAIVLTVKDGKYNAKNWLSDKNSYINMQDKWFEKNKSLGLERGKSAKETHNYHLTKQEYSKLLQKDLESIKSLSDMDRDLLAVKGLRAERKASKSFEQLKEKEELSKVINDDIFKELNNEFRFDL